MDFWFQLAMAVVLPGAKVLTHTIYIYTRSFFSVGVVVEGIDLLLMLDPFKLLDCSQLLFHFAGHYGC